MPVTYTWDGPLLVLELMGVSEPEEVIRRFQDALEDPKAADKIALLVDTRRSESLASRTPGQIRLVAEALKPYADRVSGRCAVIAEQDIHFGLSRMGSVYSEFVGVETEVFRTEDEALAWLGVRRERSRT